MLQLRRNCTASGARNRLELIYPGKNCNHSGEECQQDDATRSLIRNEKAIERLSDYAVIIAYENAADTSFRQIVISWKCHQGRVLHLVERRPVFFERRGGDLCRKSYREKFCLECFSGFGFHVVGWESEIQGNVTCSRGLGTRSLEYEIHFSTTKYNDDEAIVSVYSVFAAVSL